ncbi:hypothetical protein F3157_18105 [Virgibacillus dakarensis]|uniref:Uncharacterized protein n=1 Tax=Lentibacillus populi TaxID=1827502 RepID=A0A9W5TWT1_9BACI|nr:MULTISPECIES: hypothetical protein [Bacillaceae]MBT2214570.1 hypothetical protein [Virgibacillus dakarensis]MTW87535.1 hypothetical protein [Virgibacillus dakarensis]GGB40775.1 hypothetical protein GCM10011409_17860 [Lentibacillus populi]
MQKIVDYAIIHKKPNLFCFLKLGDARYKVGTEIAFIKIIRIILDQRGILCD